MQSFGDFFANNRILAVGILLAAVAVILAVGIALFRLVFGRRLHMSGGRTRQPRLGVVDAFDLDRQRQLVLVRRDNVEHLVMIGGPNDVVIETSIVRTAAPASTLAGRDKDNGTASPSIAIPAPQPTMTSSIASAGIQPTLPGIPAPPLSMEAEEAGQASVIAPPQRIVEPSRPAPQPVMSPPPPPPEPGSAGPDLSRPAPVGAPTAAARVGFPPVSQFPRTLPPVPQRPLPTAVPRPGPVTPSASPAPRPPVSRATPLPIARSQSTAQSPAVDRVEPNVTIPGAVPAPAAGQGLPGNGAGIRDRSGDGSESSGARVPSAAPPGRESIAPANPASPPQETNTAAQRRIEPAKRDQPVAPSSPAPVLPPRPQPMAAVPKTPSARTLESLGSLEEEMAKLLGRPVQPSDRSEG